MEFYIRDFFYVSLTVHLSITLANDKLDAQIFNHLKMKRRLLYLKAQSVPRSKHFSSRL